jgi:hypothetical protein
VHPIPSSCKRCKLSMYWYSVLYNEFTSVANQTFVAKVVTVLYYGMEFVEENDTIRYDRVEWSGVECSGLE